MRVGTGRRTQSDKLVKGKSARVQSDLRVEVANVKAK